MLAACVPPLGYPPRGLRRALAYQPHDGDAICCAPEASGESIVTLMNRMAELGQKEHPLVIEGQKVAQEQAKASKAAAEARRAERLR